MDANVINSRVVDFKDGDLFPQMPDAKKPADNPKVPMYLRRSYQVTELLCAQGDFAVGKTSEGKYVGVWKTHAYLAETLDEIRGECNAVERALLPVA